MGIGGAPRVYPDRAIRVAFTRGFIQLGISIMVAKSAGIKSLQDLNQEKYTVANLNNPQMADRCWRPSFPKAKIITFDTPSGEFLAVKSGRAQALQIDTPTADYFRRHQRQGLRGVANAAHAASQNNAIYLKPGDFKWWLWLNTFVSELRTGSLYPKYVELYQKWFGKDPPPQKFDFAAGTPGSAGLDGPIPGRGRSLRRCLISTRRPGMLFLSPVVALWSAPSVWGRACCSFCVSAAGPGATASSIFTSSSSAIRRCCCRSISSILGFPWSDCCGRRRFAAAWPWWGRMAPTSARFFGSLQGHRSGAARRGQQPGPHALDGVS